MMPCTAIVRSTSARREGTKALRLGGVSRRRNARISQAPRQQVLDTQCRRPALQLTEVEPRTVHGRNRNHVPPLAFRYLAASPVPLKLPQQYVLGGVDSEHVTNRGRSRNLESGQQATLLEASVPATKKSTLMLLAMWTALKDPTLRTASKAASAST